MIDKDNDCTFSVVIPLYNKAPHIQNTINSVLGQRSQNFEVIVVDDGSTDGGGEIVEAIDDPRIHLFRQKNAGVSAARNKGIELAQGDYIAFLDADDLWLPNHLETHNQLINKYPACGMYGSAYFVINHNRKYTKNYHANKPKGWHYQFNFEGYLDFIIEHSPYWTGVTSIRKSVFREVGLFEEDMVRGQDQDMWLRVALHSTVAFINEITATYNRDVVNPSSDRWLPVLNQGLQRHAAMVKSDDFSSITKTKIYEYYAKRMIDRGRSALNNGCRKEVFYCLKQSYKTRKYRFDFFKLLIKYFISTVIKF